MSSRMQAFRCCGATASSAGTRVAQSEMANGQRVRNTQPDGGLLGLGISPCSTMRSRRGRLTGRRRQQRGRVGMPRPLVNVRRRADLHDPAEVEHHDAIGHDLHDGKIMADEHHRQAETVLELGEEVQHLGLDRHIERGHRFVRHDEPRIGRERAGNRNTLALTA